jgi:nitrogen fixation protein NifU and related proteins
MIALDNDSSATPESVEQFHYSEILVDHARNPRNMDVPEAYNGFAINDGYCGDMMSMWIMVEEGIVKNATFHTDGCGPSIASCSMATELAKGKTIDELRDITPEKITQALGGLPSDHEHCASLAAGTLQLALTDYLNPSP